MKLKNLTKNEESDLLATIDNQGFWYAISEGGYISPEDVLNDKNDIKKVLEAIQILVEFESILPSYEDI